MTVNEIKTMAKDRGIKIIKGMKKADMICAIQSGEGNFQCFGTAENFCDQDKCTWKKDCLKKN